MVFAKYFVWGEGVWRELDVSSGRVSGWRRRAHFVFVRRGRLHVARRRSVLRALQALAGGSAGPAADGPRLSRRSKPAAAPAKRSPEPPPAAVSTACHCCAHHNGCNNNMYARSAYPSAAVSACAPTGPAPFLAGPAPGPAGPAPSAAGPSPNVGASGTQSGAHAITINVSRHRSPAAAHADVSAVLGQRAASTPRARPGPRSKRAANAQCTSSEERAPSPNRSSDGAVCKELIVPESDVEALRGFVARTRPAALQRFDADDEYKRSLFYAINPLVELKRSAALEAALRERRPAVLPHFAARLGLEPRPPPVTSAPVTSAPVTSAPVTSAPVTSAPVTSAPARARPRRWSSDASDTDKENKDAKNISLSKVRSDRNLKRKAVETKATVSEPAIRATRTGRARPAANEVNSKQTQKRPTTEAKGDASNARATRASGTKLEDTQKSNKINKAPVAVSDDSDDAVLASKAGLRPPAVTHTISKRASASGAKEYSNLEDHAIVSWVSNGSRASFVNGNKIWRELQQQYFRITGRSRSWHSLRNRYLRYILPALGALRLAPAHASRLRAAAATGAVKSKQRARAGASETAAHGAGASETAALLSRRNSMFTKEAAPRGASSRLRPPRPPARDVSHDKPSAPSAPSAAAADGPSAPARRSLRSRNVPSPPVHRSPRYSEVTRRFATRHARSSSSTVTSLERRSSSPSPPPAGGLPTRSRRLFNPNANV